MPILHTSEARPVFDVIDDLDSVTRDILGEEVTYFVLGGAATAAIKDPESKFDHQSTKLIAGPNSSESTIRDNGTLRDLDVQVLRILSKKRAKEISDRLSDALNHELVISVFGLQLHQELRRRDRVARPLGR